MNATNATMTTANGAKAIKISHLELHNFKLMSHTSSVRPEHYSLVKNIRYDIKWVACNIVSAKQPEVSSRCKYKFLTEGA